MDDWLMMGAVLLVCLMVGCVVGYNAAKPDLALKQRACWGDVARFKGDTLKVLQNYPECLPILYPERPR